MVTVTERETSSPRERADAIAKAVPVAKTPTPDSVPSPTRNTTICIRCAGVAGIVYCGVATATTSPTCRGRPNFRPYPELAALPEAAPKVLVSLMSARLQALHPPPLGCTDLVVDQV